MNAEQILTKGINDTQNELHPGEALDPVTIITIITTIIELIQGCRNPDSAVRHIRENTIQSRWAVRRAVAKAGIPLWRRWKFADTLAAKGTKLSVADAKTLVDESAELPPTPPSSENWWPGVMSLLIAFILVFSVGQVNAADSYWPTQDSYWPTKVNTPVQTPVPDVAPDPAPSPPEKDYRNKGELIYYFGDDNCSHCPAMEELANRLYGDGYNVQNVKKSLDRSNLEERYNVHSYPQFVIVDSATKQIKRRIIGGTEYGVITGTAPKVPSDTISAPLPYSANRWTWPGNSRQSLISHLQGGVHGFTSSQLQGMSTEQLIGLHNGDHEAKRGGSVQYYHKQSYPGTQARTIQSNTQYQRARPQPTRVYRSVRGTCPSC